MKIARLGLDRGPRYAVLDEDSDEFVLLSDDPLFGSVTPTGRRLPADRARLVSPMIPRSKVVGFAGTYDEEPCAAPAGLTVFLKPNTAVIGPGDPIVPPAFADRLAHGVWPSSSAEWPRTVPSSGPARRSSATPSRTT